jgi:chemotaxis protein MotB
MRTLLLSSVLVFISLSLLGCGPSAEELKVQNDMQRKRIQQLESELQTASLQLDQFKRQLETCQGREGIEADALSQKVAALEEDIARKKALIESMQAQLLLGGAALPVELSTLLEDFAKSSDMIDYDSVRGIVKFKSDLLFDKGSANVAQSAIASLKELARILNSKQGSEFDVIVAGHTDDMRISRPATKAQHATNWHLSAHRAISVLNIMGQNNLDSERMSVRGFGEYRPIVPNKAAKKGNPQNRRVEIYIVPKGV